MTLEEYSTGDLPNNSVLKSAVYIENVSSNRGTFWNYDFRASRFKELFIELNISASASVFDVTRENRYKKI